MYGGTWKHEHTVSAVHFNCSISCASTAVTLMASYLRPSPSTATLPELSPVKFSSQCFLRRAAVSSVINPGADSTPPGREPLPKKFVELVWMRRPCTADRPQA